MKFKTQKDKQGAMMISAVVLAFLVVIGYKLMHPPGPPLEADGCVSPVVRNTVVILDHSEAVSEQTQSEIVARSLAAVADKAQVNERITVFRVSELSKKSMEPIFSQCKLPQEGNRLTEGVKAIAKNYQKRFLEPLKQALQVEPDNAKESPIAQAIIDVSLSQYLRGQTNQLLVFSDLMEHNDKSFSLYSCSPHHDVIDEFRRFRRGTQERPAFRNTAIQLNIIPRKGLADGALKCRDKLWPWFFGDAEGANSSLTTDYLPGA
jgi:hypothetical protein